MGHYHTLAVNDAHKKTILFKTNNDRHEITSEKQENATRTHKHDMGPHWDASKETGQTTAACLTRGSHRHGPVPTILRVGERGGRDHLSHRTKDSDVATTQCDKFQKWQPMHEWNGSPATETMNDKHTVKTQNRSMSTRINSMAKGKCFP